MVFLFGAGILGYAYWKVTGDVNSLTTAYKILPPILMGIVGTISIFWSLSGFVIQVAQKMKSTYLKDTNMFVLRQINNKINTTIVSMSVICLMLFMTISILSVSLALRNTMQRELVKMTPVDLNLYKTANLPESYMKYGKEVKTTEAQRADSRITIQETLKNNGLDMTLLKDVIEIPIYATNDLTMGDFLKNKLQSIKLEFPMLAFETAEEIVKISDYNKIASLYGIEQYELKENEYIVLCDFDGIGTIRDRVLADENILEIAGKEYKSKYNECKSGFIMMSTSHMNTGVILVPDSCNLTDDMKEKQFLVANFNANTDEEKQEIEEIFRSNDSSVLIQNLNENGLEIDGMTKISIIESSVGVATIVTFIAIYLGIIFLIASAAILALKQLTESSDNKQRYTILRKIGCDEKMINKALFRQIGIFFGLPLILAIIHSIFGIQFAMTVMEGLASSEDLLPSIVATVVIIGAIYGAYFIATYLGSKNIIKEEE